MACWWTSSRDTAERLGRVRTDRVLPARPAADATDLRRTAVVTDRSDGAGERVLVGEVRRRLAALRAPDRPRRRRRCLLTLLGAGLADQLVGVGDRVVASADGVLL